jgi:hypothetical protein
MPPRLLPNDPSFEHLRKQAKRLLTAVRAGDAEALALVREFHPRAQTGVAHLSLIDAQLVTARSYGFASWAKLKQHLIAIKPYVWNPPASAEPTALPDRFVRFACLDYGGWHRSNAEKARQLLTEHPDVSIANVYTAAASGDVAALGAILEREPRLVNRKGGFLHWEPLLYACYSRVNSPNPAHSTLEVARVLLAHGADPNAGFLWAGRYPFTGITGAFGEGEDSINEPPHQHAVALATLLLDAGADPNDSQTLYNRHFKENDDHFRVLFAYGLGQPIRPSRLNRVTEGSSSLAAMLVQELCWAAIHNFPRRVELLLAHGVDPNAPCPRSDRTPYEEAVRAGHEAMAEDLVRRGARRVQLDPVETFALACINGRRDEVRHRLADHPALLDELGPTGRVELLHRALDAKNRDGIRLIVELGVDINGMIPHSGLDRTVLHNAAGWGGLEMVKFLLDLGADPNRRDATYDATPLGWATHNDQREVVEYLKRLAGS